MFLQSAGLRWDGFVLLSIFHFCYFRSVFEGLHRLSFVVRSQSPYCQKKSKFLSISNWLSRITVKALLFSPNFAIHLYRCLKFILIIQKCYFGIHLPLFKVPQMFSGMNTGCYYKLKCYLKGFNFAKRQGGFGFGWHL